jgi:hypothetical protein
MHAFVTLRRGYGEFRTEDGRYGTFPAYSEQELRAFFDRIGVITYETRDERE